MTQEREKALEKFLWNECRERIEEILAAEDVTAHYGVEVDLIALQNAAPEICSALLLEPETTLPMLDEALHSMQMAIKIPNSRIKSHLHARVCHLPSTPAYLKRNVSVLRTSDIGKLLSVLGTVTRTGSVMLREASRWLYCTTCKTNFEIFGDITRRGAFDMPAKCPNEEAPCKGRTFCPTDTSPTECREYQEIKVQEKVQNLDIGSIPRSLIVVLTDDLADNVKPGDDVVVSGVLHRRWNKNLIPDMRCDVELMLVAVHISSHNEKKSFLHVTEESKQAFAAHWAAHAPQDQLIARNAILKSICPQIFGMYLLKLILAMSLIGGVSYKDPSGARIRGESHLLLVGDPGTAKSQILRYAAKVSPRSVLTTGIGTTSAGLTVTAVREPGTGEWMLDAGALVLADGGVCCIDEFDGIRAHDRGAIHEAMEQQTLSVAKAGLVCTLDTRATVIAAVNPKGGRICTEIGTSDEAKESNGSDDDTAEKLPITVGIASPLLSRFDVVLTLLDQHNEEWDRKLSSFILNGYKAAGDDSACSDGVWSTERLRQYLYYIKANLKPRLSFAAQRLLTKYYTMERGSSSRNTARTTVRLLEALVRMAQAHARLMFRETATPLDAVFAIAAVEASAVVQQVVGGSGALHASFPDDPVADFERYSNYLLAKLGLEDEEINFYEDAPVGDAA